MDRTDIEECECPVEGHMTGCPNDLWAKALCDLERGKEPVATVVDRLCDLALRGRERGADPVAWLLPKDAINDIQTDSIERLIRRAKHAHYVDVKIRINGQDEHYQADWLKHLQLSAPPASSGTVQVPKEAECKVYVPGLWRCAKCKLDLIATALSNQGHFANNNPQACPNGCGPMWRVTERDQRQEAQRLFEREFDARKEAERKLGDLLARIHRDGGHYTGQHGMEKSVEDAHTIVATLFADERKLEEAGNMLPADLWNKAIGLGERRGMERAAVICEETAKKISEITRLHDSSRADGAHNALFNAAIQIRAAADTKERTDG